MNYQDTYKHKGLRNRLISILSDKGIRSQPVLDAISQLPRHFFMPQDFEMHAYEDKAFPIGEGQTISQPYTVAYQTELLEIHPGDKVLEIGTGSGYQCAVLAMCGAEVYSIERHEPLAEKAKELLACFSFHTEPRIYTGDGTRGLPAYAPYNKIIVTAGAPSVPKALVNQLANGGILVIPVGREIDTQRMVRITKNSADDIRTDIFANFSFVPLVGENGWKG